MDNFDNLSSLVNFDFNNFDIISLQSLKEELLEAQIDMKIVAKIWHKHALKSKGRLEAFNKLDPESPDEKQLSEYDLAYKSYAVYESQFMKVANMLKTLDVSISIIDKLILSVSKAKPEIKN